MIPSFSLAIALTYPNHSVQVHRIFSLLSVHGSFYRLVPNRKKTNPCYFEKYYLKLTLVYSFPQQQTL